MESRTKAFVTGGIAVVMLIALTAAARPIVFAQTSGGLWELSGAGGAERTARQCLADPVVLAQFEHRGRSCARTAVRNHATRAEIHYSCSNGEFGRTEIAMLTPRSLRVETQGIARGAPFHYVFQARRIGKCPGH